MNRMWTFLGGLGAGTFAMYLLDPDGGARRRALIRDKVTSLAQCTQDWMGKAGRDLANRARGVAATTRGMLGGRTDDPVLVERVRSKVGRWVSHPSAIDVRAERGDVVLSGLILEEELEGLLRAVSRVRGVRSVEDELEPHRSGENVPELQGGRPAEGELPEWRQERLTPGIQLLAGVAAMTAALLLLRRMRHEEPAEVAVPVHSTGMHRSPRHTRH